MVPEVDKKPATMDCHLTDDLTSACPGCGTQNRGSALVCNLCSQVLRKARPNLRPGSAADLLTPHAGAGQDYAQTPLPPSSRFEPQGAHAQQAYMFLGLGLLLAPVFAFVPYLGFFNWFLGALIHESGHCLFAWAMGQPAFPAISLSGHAMAVHQEQVTLLALAVCGGLGVAAWNLRAHRTLAMFLTAAAVLQPIFAFTSAKEILFLLGGHLGELGFATVCIWRTLSGGFTQNNLERALYAILGWYLIGSHAVLCAGLLFSQAARVEYAGNGSFGLTNDYLRLANDVLGTSLPTVAFGMLILSLVPLPAAWFLWRRSG
ncbi:MAG: hypothetical protein JKY61_05420 [Planctomycetes bacterium]|nr:hypothetical protein [Planctomycetota bacterium]